MMDTNLDGFKKQSNKVMEDRSIKMPFFKYHWEEKNGISYL